MQSLLLQSVYTCECEYVAAELKIKDTLVTDRGEAGYDPGSGHVATAGDPLTGNYQTAAGNVTTAGREDQKLK